MTIGLLLITHDHIGNAMIESATNMLGMCPMSLEVVSVTAGCRPDVMMEMALAAIDRLDQGGGVLVLTDMYGSTPSNIANRLVGLERVRVVAGLNLPMLVRVLNYPRLELKELAQKAVSGGRDGIFACEAS
ncbi:MAG: PTS fructose transporter subunit IIA [Gammaproteobacteria bacterium]|nr:PTS fructose transporter subunit IIA [Gammaproteobacteria bacterium]